MLFYSDVNMVKYLLEKGAEIDAKTNIRIPGITPPSPPSFPPSPHTHTCNPNSMINVKLSERVYNPLLLLLSP